MKKSGDFAEVLYFVGVPDGTVLHQMVAQRKKLYAVCDVFEAKEICGQKER